MNIHDVARWKRCEELAKICRVTITLKGGFSMTKKNGEMLGIVATVDELYGFLCGYERVPRTANKEISIPVQRGELNRGVS